MFLKLIKDYFIKKEVKINSEPYKPTAKTVGVLLDAFELEKIDELKNKFKHDLFKDYEVVFLQFNEEKAKAKILDKSEISSKSFNWLGNMKDPLIDDFKKNDYFLLLGVFDNNLYLNKIIQGIPALYKFGFNEPNNHIFNVSLNGLPVKTGEFYPLLKRKLISFNIIK